jgi:hypothetical protein
VAQFEPPRLRFNIVQSQVGPNVDLNVHMQICLSLFDFSVLIASFQRLARLSALLTHFISAAE